jgi:transcriptional regulator with XRE-family HTH domain
MKAQSNYLQNAQFRIENKKWLNYSSNIALRIIAALDQQANMTQKALAEKLEVSPQYINKILKGQENLSLATIAKISEVLNVELISFPNYLFDKPHESKIVRSSAIKQSKYK